MRKSNVALRLQPSLLGEARRVAESEGVALNQLINVAVAEKLSALRVDDYFRERAARTDMRKAKNILRRAGTPVAVRLPAGCGAGTFNLLFNDLLYRRLEATCGRVSERLSKRDATKNF